MTISFIHHPDCQLHETDPSHPESAARLTTILSHIAPIQHQLLMIHATEADQALLTLVHSPTLIDQVNFNASMARPMDSDTETSFLSYDAARYAAGAGPTAVELFQTGEINLAFAAVRPPGHHATAERAMGFCLFNNIAITARYAQRCGYRRVLIVDFDVHHGNGTQEIFYDDGSICYFSTHQHPAYPGTGLAESTGVGDGVGTTFNFPLPPGSGDSEVVTLYQKPLKRVAEQFGPEIVLISAGYDLHQLDPLADFNVTLKGIEAIVEAILQLGAMPKLFLLEGGYHLEALGKSVRTTLEVMMRYDV